MLQAIAPIWYVYAIDGFYFSLIQYAVMRSFGGCGVLAALYGQYSAIDTGKLEDSLGKVVPRADAFV